MSDEKEIQRRIEWADKRCTILGEPLSDRQKESLIKNLEEPQDEPFTHIQKTFLKIMFGSK
jgi:hypothetical protein